MNVLNLCSVWLFLHAWVGRCNQVTWELMTIPAVFGKNVDLICKLPPNTCCRQYTRRWLGGYGLPLLTMNGVSTKPEKYSEKLDDLNFTSILTIHRFESSDANIPYACSYGFNKDAKLLELSEIYFEAYNPGLIEANITTTNSFLQVNISMKEVYPVPNCTATMSEKDISDEIRLISYSNELLYNAMIHLTHKLEVDDCNGVFNITCNIRSIMFKEVHAYNCSDQPLSKRSRLSLVYVFTVSTLLLVFLCILFSCFYSFLYDRIKCRGSVKRRKYRLDYIYKEAANETSNMDSETTNVNLEI